MLFTPITAKKSSLVKKLLLQLLLLLLLLLLHPLNGLFSTLTWVSQCQKGKTSLDLNEARDDGVLGCSVCKCIQFAPHSIQITTSTPHHSIFLGRMLFLTPNQQCQSVDGVSTEGFYITYLKQQKILPHCHCAAK